MKIQNESISTAALLLAGTLAGGCTKEEEPAPTRVAPPQAAANPLPAAVETLAFTVAERGTASFLIDAPLEKIKGTAARFRGKLAVNPQHLAEARGQIDVDLTTLATHTFEEEGKNAKQTEHARNWLELGNDVPVNERLENQWVRFSIKSLTATPGALTEAQVVDNRRSVEMSARGELWLHGVAVPKSVKVAVSFAGDPLTPSEISIVTLEPLRVSLREHDVKPRDLAGKFLQGALEQVGDKIVDEVQLSLNFTATPSTNK